MAFEKHLLVDGANVLHAWPELRVRMKRDRDSARRQLARQIAAIHDAEAVRVTLVFDGRGPEMIVEQPFEHATFAVIYTPSSLTADDIIEQLVGRAADASACVVATGDQAERGTIEAAGAVWMPPADLAAWVGRAESRLTTRVSSLKRTNEQAWRRTSHE